MIRLRKIADPQSREVFRLIAQLNHKLDLATYRRYVKQMLKADYFMLGAYDGKVLVGLTGCWTATKFYCGKYLEIDNFVVDESRRRDGIGDKIMKHVLSFAKRKRYNSVVLNAYLWNEGAHRFYDRYGFEVIGKHRIVRLKRQ